jgi:hypothetical protein
VIVSKALGYELDDRGARVRFPAEAGNFSLYHRVQNGTAAHPAFYPMGTQGLFPWKWLGREADHSPPSSAEVKEWLELYLHSPNTSSWRGAQLKHRDNFNFCLPFLLFKCVSIYFRKLISLNETKETLYFTSNSKSWGTFKRLEKVLRHMCR